MSELRLKDIVSVLDSYGKDFGFLDVFASDVVEFRESRGVFSPIDANNYRAVVEGRALHMQMFRDKNVARFNLVTQESTDVAGGALAGAAVGALIGAAFDSTNRKQSPTGVIFGLLLGGFLGAAASQPHSTTRPTRQVLTLRYDPDDQQWKVYHGPYLGWAKEALRAE